MKTHQITSHDMTWHLATNHITSPHVTSQPTAVLHRSLQPTTSKQVTTSPPWNGWRLVHSKNSVWASQWLVTLCTFYRQSLSLTYSFFFETSAPGLPGSTCIIKFPNPRNATCTYKACCLHVKKSNKSGARISWMHWSCEYGCKEQLSWGAKELLKGVKRQGFVTPLGQHVLVKSYSTIQSFSQNLHFKVLCFALRCGIFFWPWSWWFFLLAQQESMDQGSRWNKLGGLGATILAQNDSTLNGWFFEKLGTMESPITCSYNLVNQTPNGERTPTCPIDAFCLISPFW